MLCLAGNLNYCSMFGIRDEISSGEWYWGNDETRKIRWE